MAKHWTSRTEALFQEEKHKLECTLTYMKSCNDYGSSEAYNAIVNIRTVCYRLATDEEYKKFADRMVDVMIQQRFAQLMVKLVNSCNKAAYDFRHALTCVFTHLLYHMHNSNRAAYQKMVAELVKSGIIRSLIRELSMYDPNTTDPRQQTVITDSLIDLFNLHRAPNAILFYRAADAVKVLKKFITADNVMTKINSLRVLAIIANEDECQCLATSGECIVNMLDVLQMAAEAEDKKYHFEIKIDDTEKSLFFIPLRKQSQGINDLASNDINKQAIVQCGGVPILISLLKHDYEDDVRQEAVEALWKLSFLESNKAEILAHATCPGTTAVQDLKDMRYSANPKLCDASRGMLHQLGILDIHEDPPVEKQTPSTAVQLQSTSSTLPCEPPPSYEATMATSHVMISYKWDKQDRAVKVRDVLKRKGFNVWMDVEKLEGNILVSMANAVEEADAVLVCVSRSYKSSVNCQAEAHYAYQQQKPIIPLMVEEDYKPDGWLGMMTAMKKYIRAYSDEVLEKDLPDLLRELGNKGRAV